MRKCIPNVHNAQSAMCIHKIFLSFDSMDVGGFVFSDQLLQISSLLPSHYVYGLGEHNGPFLKSTNWKQYTMWNMDSAPSDTVCFK